MSDRREILRFAQNDRTRVAYFCHEYPKYTETFVYREIDRVRSLGLDVPVFAMKRPTRPDAIEGVREKMSAAHYLAPDFSARFILAQLIALLRRPIVYLKLLWTILTTDGFSAAAPLNIRIGMFLRGALGALDIAQKKSVRIIHCPATGDELIAAYVASELTGIPLSFTLHAPLALYRSSPLLAAAARRAGLIAAISEDARRRIIELAGAKIEGHVRVIHCGVDLPVTTSPADATERRVLSVASLARYKGHDVLIRAIGLLASKGVDVTCEIVGEGPERPTLEKLIRDLGIESRIKLPGGKLPADVAVLLEGERCLALASRVDEKGARDGVPIALMEAMAHARPCVATRVSGIPELVKDGETGFVVESDDPGAMAAAIERLLDDPAIARRMGEKGREVIEREYSLDKSAALLNSEFRKIANTLVYISHQYPKTTETFIKREVEALREAGLRVKVYSFQKPNGDKAASTIYMPGPKSLMLFPGAVMYMARHPIRTLGLLWSVIFGRRAAKWRGGWGEIVDIIRGAWIARDCGRDVAGIHAGFASVSATAAWVAGGLTGIPFGFSSHSSPPDPLLGVKCRDASWIFSESEFDRNYIGGDAPSEIRGKVSVVRCGLKVEDWPEPDWQSDRYAVGNTLFVGSLGPKKGVIQLMEAVVRLVKEGIDFKLDVVGNGPLRGEMQAILKNAGAERSVRFHGELPFEELYKLYYRARFFTLPAIVTPQGDRDGIPVSLMEAMASGLASVSTPVSGIPELVEDLSTGFLVPPGDTGKLAEALKNLWENPAKCRDMGKKGRERVFRLHPIDGQVRAFIGSLISRGVLADASI